MSDFGFIKNGPEQRQHEAMDAEILAEYVATVHENLLLLRSLGQLSHPSAARMATGINMRPAPEQIPADNNSEASRMAASARQQLANMPDAGIKPEDIGLKDAA